MRFPRLGASLTAAVLVVALAACGGKADSGGLPSTSTTPSDPLTSTPSTSTPPPQPTAAPIRSTQKYSSLTLVLDHSAQPPANAKVALQVYEDYERSAHRSEATNVEDPNLGKKASGQPLQRVRDILRNQKSQGVRTGGSITVTVRLVRASAAAAAFSGCYDQSKSLLVRANGTSYTGPLTKKYPRLKLNVIITNVAGLWLVTERNLKADRC
ncbi:MAG TPA: hypothetical protein VGD71_33485 [Kribbella sp.]|jgi:hypothetical protein